MVADGLRVFDHRAVILADAQTPRRRLLVGHGYRAEIGGPARAVPRIKRVVHLAREVVDAEAIEPAGVRAPEQVEAAALVGGEVRVEGHRLRREVIGGVGTHLVQVNKYHRPPLAHGVGVTAGLGLSEGKPVAVEVKDVVVLPA